MKLGPAFLPIVLPIVLPAFVLLSACGGDAISASAAGPPNAETRSFAATAGRTVLLIPGTTITGDWFDTMHARLKNDGYNPIIFEPPDLFTESLVTGAKRIAAEVQRRLAESGETTLDIVAECDGGVATRYYLQFLGGDAYVERAVTFVSAHHGSWASPIAAWTTGWPALYEIIPGSRFMQKLNGTALPASVAFTSIYTCNDEVMYPYETSVISGATNVLFCDHYIGHFDGFWDRTVYERIRAALRDETAPTYY
jgi:triacylglycerol lipase